MDFDKDHNQVVWCRAACGNNVHKSCFDQYIASQRGSVVRCVYWYASKVHCHFLLCFCLTPADTSHVAQSYPLGDRGWFEQCCSIWNPGRGRLCQRGSLDWPVVCSRCLFISPTLGEASLLWDGILMARNVRERKAVLLQQALQRSKSGPLLRFA